MNKKKTEPFAEGLNDINARLAFVQKCVMK